LPHAVFLAVVALECVTAGRWHQSSDALRRTLDTGTPRQRVYALFVLTNRDTPQTFDRDSTRRLLKSDAALVREWTMTANFTRPGPPLAQEAYNMSLGTAPHGIPCRFLLDYRPVVGSPMTLADLRRFLDVSRVAP
jgi:hypothetical protein